METTHSVLFAINEEVDPLEVGGGIRDKAVVPPDRGAGHPAQIDGPEETENFFYDVIHVHFAQEAQKVEALPSSKVPSPVHGASLA